MGPHRFRGTCPFQTLLVFAPLRRYCHRYRTSVGVRDARKRVVLVCRGSWLVAVEPMTAKPGGARPPGHLG